MASDPFRYHPELATLIRDPRTSFFRDFDIEAFVAGMPAGAVIDFILPEAVREAGRRRFLEGRRDADLWVFAYGSLMWDPGFHFTEVRKAHAPHHERRFILKDTFGGRGTPERPGVMAALDEGHGCDGLAFRIARDAIEEETRQLWARERAGPAYIEAMIPLELSDRSVEAVAFLADYSARLIDPNLSREDQIAYAATGAGRLGSSYEYIENLARGFAAIGIDDAEVSGLLAAINEKRART